MKSLASVMSDTESIGAAAEAYHRIFDGLPPDKDRAVRMMMAACANAREAYRLYLESDGAEPSVSDQISAGNFAFLFLDGIASIRVILGKRTDEDAVATLQASSEWLKDKGWHGILDFRVGNRILYKTATETHSDMGAYRMAGMRIRNELAAKREVRR